MKSKSFQYQAKSTKMSFRQLSPRNWSWLLSDFMMEVIDNGKGCATKSEARTKAKAAKKIYLKNLPKPKKVKKTKNTYGRRFQTPL